MTAVAASPAAFARQRALRKARLQTKVPARHEMHPTASSNRRSVCLRPNPKHLRSTNVTVPRHGRRCLALVFSPPLRLAGGNRPGRGRKSAGCGRMPRPLPVPRGDGVRNPRHKEPGVPRGAASPQRAFLQRAINPPGITWPLHSNQYGFHRAGLVMSPFVLQGNSKYFIK